MWKPEGVHLYSYGTAEETHFIGQLKAPASLERQYLVRDLRFMLLRVFTMIYLIFFRLTRIMRLSWSVMRMVK